MKWGEFLTQTGQRGNIFNPSDWAKMILGGAVLLISFAASQNLVRKLGSKVPYIDTTIDPITKQPLAEGPTKRVY